jgi:hypothetical protein
MVYTNGDRDDIFAFPSLTDEWNDLCYGTDEMKRHDTSRLASGLCVERS